MRTSQPAGGPINWSQVKATFYLDGAVYDIRSSDGHLESRTYDGTTFGAWESRGVETLEAS